MALFISTFQKSFASSPPKKWIPGNIAPSLSRSDRGSRLTGVNQLTFKKMAVLLSKLPQQLLHILANIQQEGSSSSYTMPNPTPIMLYGCGHTHIQNTGIPALSLAAPQGWYWRGFLGEEERLSFKPLKREPGRKYQISISMYVYFMSCVFQFVQT